MRLRVLGWFGALIGNTDMHLGNAGLMLTDTRPLTLAPAYDMSPTGFRPASSGEVLQREYRVVPPTPDQQAAWRTAAVIALHFWRSVAAHDDISGEFRVLAGNAATLLEHTADRFLREDRASRDIVVPNPGRRVAVRPIAARRHAPRSGMIAAPAIGDGSLAGDGSCRSSW